MITRPGFPWSRIPNSLVRRRAERGVQLTFDDGPHPIHTRAVLERLAKWNVKAIFFVVGKFVDKHPDVLREIVTAGHEIGNHTYAHKVASAWALQAVTDDVRRCHAAIERACGVQPKWFRPPLGRVNVATLTAAARCGYRTMNWSLDSNDWRCRNRDDAEKCAEAILREVRPGDTLLLHDCHEWIAPILDRILPLLLAEHALE